MDSMVSRDEDAPLPISLLLLHVIIGSPHCDASSLARSTDAGGEGGLTWSMIFLRIPKERFNTMERVFAWEDKFRHLLLRFDRISQVHYAFKTLVYTMINLRHFCQG
jgi:hypothetical protein